MNGVLIIDKPAGMTSHDVVNRARRILRQRSVGHLGTLDPMATGVLPLVTGNFTRLAQFYVSSEKVYDGAIRFGFSTDTYDAEGDPTSPQQPVTLLRDQLEAVAAKFRGVITQIPPPFSAKKVKGVPAYKLARKQQKVLLQPVQVEIKEFEILSLEGGGAKFRARVSSGTYMRSVAHDMGQLLGCGAHLESLRRSAVAEFTLAEAHTLEELSTASTGSEATDNRAVSMTGGGSQEIEGCHFDGILAIAQEKGIGVKGHYVPVTLDTLFIHPRKLLPQFPSVSADEATTAIIRTGRSVNLPELSRARQVKVFSGQRDLIAIATRVAGTLFHPRIVLCG